MDAPACLAAGRWHVAQTEPRREQLALHAVVAAGLVAYLPRCFERVRAGRRERVVEKPLFPAYLFVKCLPQPEHWQLVFTAPGIAHMLGMQRPTCLPDDAIDAVRLAEAQRAERDAKRRTRPVRSGIVWHFTPGDVVRVTEGPFAGFHAQLTTAVDPHDRVRALLTMLGRPSTIELPAHHVAVLTA
jgi:transcriptional antiterminator NusG